KNAFMHKIDVIRNSFINAKNSYKPFTVCYNNFMRNIHNLRDNYQSREFYQVLPFLMMYVIGYAIKYLTIIMLIVAVFMHSSVKVPSLSLRNTILAIILVFVIVIIWLRS